MKVILVVKKDDINQSGGQPLWDIWERADCIGGSDDGAWQVLLADSSCLSAIGVRSSVVSGLTDLNRMAVASTVACRGEEGQAAGPARIMSAGLTEVSRGEEKKDNRIRLQPSKRLVHVGDKAIELKNREFQLLYHLVSNPEKIFSKQELYDEIWGKEAKGNLNTVTVHINRIRSKLEKEPARPRYIHTVWGMGYRFKG